MAFMFNLWACSSGVEQLPFKQFVMGSIPIRPSTLRQGFVWQATET